MKIVFQFIQTFFYAIGIIIGIPTIVVTAVIWVPMLIFGLIVKVLQDVIDDIKSKEVSTNLKNEIGVNDD